MDLCLVGLGMISIFITSVTRMYSFKIRKKVDLKTKTKHRRSQNNEHAPVPDQEDVSSVFVFMLLCVSTIGNCFRICSPRRIRLADIFIILFTLEIEFWGPGKALTWLQNQPSITDSNHQKPGDEILPVATVAQANSPAQKIRSALKQIPQFYDLGFS